MPLAPNQQLFEYRIVRVLGWGAFGVVYHSAERSCRGDKTG